MRRKFQPGIFDVHIKLETGQVGLGNRIEVAILVSGVGVIPAREVIDRPGSDSHEVFRPADWQLNDDLSIVVL